MRGKYVPLRPCSFTSPRAAQHPAMHVAAERSQASLPWVTRSCGGLAVRMFNERHACPTPTLLVVKGFSQRRPLISFYSIAALYIHPSSDTTIDLLLQMGGTKAIMPNQHIDQVIEAMKSSQAVLATLSEDNARLKEVSTFAYHTGAADFPVFSSTKPIYRCEL